jgi:CheY-like chemotaxis protein
MQTILLTADLACSSRVAGAAAAGSVACETAMTVDRLLERLAGEPARLVLVDLTTPGLDCLTLVPALRAAAISPLAIIAFGPHVHEQHLAAAQRAGCDLVLARGQFYARATEIIQRYAGGERRQST